MKAIVAAAMTVGFAIWLIGSIVIGRAHSVREYVGWLLVTLGAFVWGMARQSWKHITTQEGRR